MPRSLRHFSKLMDENHLGVKTGKGWYDYSDGKDVEAMKRRDKNFFKMLYTILKVNQSGYGACPCIFSWNMI